MAERLYTPLEVLRKYWKYSSFRPPQDAVIDSVLKGNDTVALLPTGGGKSICYQVPALLLPGLTLVISPLVALMRDQVAALRRRHIPAAALHAGLSEPERERVYDACADGRIKLLYVSPERLRRQDFLSRLSYWRVSLTAVDEAHCISQWGHDFRPAYRKIARLRETLPEVPLLAVTATATPETRKDIIERLGMQAPQVFQADMERKNIILAVRPTANKISKAIEILRKVSGSAIIYLRSRRRTEQWAAYLRKAGIEADYYHAGLPHGQRHHKYRQWMKGATRVMTATTAFGMGIDKPDVRLVIHGQLPESIESYIQEAGRAGRDGKRAYAVTLFTPGEEEQLVQNAARHPLTYEDLRIIYDRLMLRLGIPYGHQADRPISFDLGAFLRELRDYTPQQVLDAFTFLEDLELLSYQGNLSLPHRIRSRATPQELYDYALRHPAYEPLIQLLLRAYALRETWITISIDKTAEALRLRPLTIRRQLETLHSSGLIELEINAHTDWIYMPAPRPHPDHFPVHPEIETLLSTREEVKRRKAQDLAAFITQTDRCRTAVLLEYFGQEAAPYCGHCDVCLDASGALNPVQTAVLKALAVRPLRWRELSRQLQVPDRQLNEALRALLDNQQIVRKSERYFLAGGPAGKRTSSNA